jgi:hypothetical protein
LRDRLDAARRRLEARAKARAEAERADYEKLSDVAGSPKGEVNG